MTEIYIFFTKDGVPRTRAVQADLLAPNQYLITPQPYDRLAEKWEFEPGTKVKCNTVMMGGKAILFASARID